MDNGWNGSTFSFGGGVTPLIDLHQPDDPAEFKTTGSTDTTNTNGAGQPKNSFTASFLGSKCPVAGTCCAITSNIGKVSNRATKTYPQALITQMSISGRKDGRIEGSLTAVPGDPSLTAITNTWTVASDLGFNGSTFSFGSELTGLISANYTSSAAAIESTGADDSDTLNTPGIPDESITITCLGPPQATAKSIGATVMSWKDGGSLGTFANAKLMSTHPGGALDGQQTTEYVFKPILSTTTAAG